MPFSPLGRGFLTGKISTFEDLPERDLRRAHPRFTGEAFDTNQASVAVVRDIAGAIGATEENLGAVGVDLSAEHIARLDAITAAGPRALDPTWINRSTPPLPV